VQQDLSLIGSMLNYYAQGDVWPYWKRDSDFKDKRTQAMEVKKAK